MSLSMFRTFALLGAASVVPAALADTATLTISGRVLSGTYTLAAPPIALDPTKADEVIVGDNGLKNGSLDFTGCVGVTKAMLGLDCTAATGDPQRWQNSAVDAAACVSVALNASATGNTCLTRGDTGVEVPVAGASASYVLRAGHYVPTLAAVRGGAVATEITVTADYE